MEPSDKHLVSLVGQESSHQLIEDTINELYRNSNKLLAQFSKVDIDLKYTRLKTFCKCLYGLQLWDFQDMYCKKFSTAWYSMVQVY